METHIFRKLLFEVFKLVLFFVKLNGLVLMVFKQSFNQD